MAEMTEPLHPAGKWSNHDWAGTASAENNVTIYGTSLRKLTGLDDERWSIVGIDWYTHGKVGDERGDVYVYAFDRLETGIGSYDEMRAYADREGSLPVTSFLLHDVDFQTIIRESFKGAHVQLISKGIHDAEIQLNIVRKDDIPEQA